MPSVLPFAGLDPECSQPFLVNDLQKTVFDLPANDTIWDGSAFFTLKQANQKTQLAKFDGNPKSATFGHELNCVDVPGLVEKPFCLTKRDNGISVFAQTFG